MNRKIELEKFLRQTKADQGGEASFEDWVRCTAGEETEYGHEEAKEYLAHGGDLSDKDKDASAAWAPQKEFAFDVTLLTMVRIKAGSRKEAEATLRDILGGARCNAGSYPNGDPVLFEISIEGELDLIEVDGETV